MQKFGGDAFPEEKEKPDRLAGFKRQHVQVANRPEQSENTMTGGDQQIITVNNEDVIDPFLYFDAPVVSDPNKTLAYLDLWNNDANCTNHQVVLLDNNSLQPGALVSFPGSGNSWLRMLLMGISGVFIHSVYPGDDTVFQSPSNSIVR